jgi:hypothetical protein
LETLSLNGEFTDMPVFIWLMVAGKPSGGGNRENKSCKQAYSSFERAQTLWTE